MSPSPYKITIAFLLCWILVILSTLFTNEKREYANIEDKHAKELMIFQLETSKQMSNALSRLEAQNNIHSLELQTDFEVSKIEWNRWVTGAKDYWWDTMPDESPVRKARQYKGTE